MSDDHEKLAKAMKAAEILGSALQECIKKGLLDSSNIPETLMGFTIGVLVKGGLMVDEIREVMAKVSGDIEKYMQESGRIKEALGVKTP